MRKNKHILVHICPFPFETSRDGAVCCWGRGSVRDWRRREGLSGNLLLDSPPFSSPRRGNSSVPHKQKVGLSLRRGNSSNTTTGRAKSHCRRCGSNKLSGGSEASKGSTWETPSATVRCERSSGQRAAVPLSAKPPPPPSSSSEVGSDTVWQRLGSSRAPGFEGTARGSTWVSSVSAKSTARGAAVSASFSSSSKYQMGHFNSLIRERILSHPRVKQTCESIEWRAPPTCSAVNASTGVVKA